MMFSRKNRCGFLGVALTATALVTVSLGVAAQPAHATDSAIYYVATVANGGDDGNPGTQALPLKTFKEAMKRVDSFINNTIYVTAGTYTEQLRPIRKNHLTIKGIGLPLLTYSGPVDTIVDIQGSQYVTVYGFVIDGGKGTTGVPDAGDDCNGVSIKPRSMESPIAPSYHITISGNTIRNMGGAGVATDALTKDTTPTYGCDYISISGNTISNTNSTGQNGSSGISLLDMVTSDNGGGNHNTIQNNIVCNSYVNYGARLHSDGNGIIIDTGGDNVAATVIQNNVVYNNSGRGIYVFNASNVTIIDNTVYQNCRDVVLLSTKSPSIGEIVTYSYSYSNPGYNKNIKIYNNLAVSRGTVNFTNPSTGQPDSFSVANYVVLRNNKQGTIYPVDPDDTNQPVNITLSHYNSWKNGQNNLFMMRSTPTLLNLSPSFTNSAAGDFSQAYGSSTIDAGTNTVKAGVDILGNPRPFNGGIADLGAYEAQFIPTTIRF